MSSAFRNCSFIINIFEKTGSLQSNKGNLFLGGVDTLQDASFKQQLAVDCVLSVADKQAYSNHQIASKIKQYQISHHKWIQTGEGESLYPLFETSNSFLKQYLSQCNVMVHCQMGVSRSPTLVIAFLMQQQGMSLQDARAYVKSRREIISPNETFTKDLQKLDQQLHEGRAKST